MSGERTTKLTLDLLDAVEAYLSEVDNPVPDYAHRRLLRERMRAKAGDLRKATT